MKVHRLDCASMRPIGGSLVSGTGPLFATAGMVCRCVLVEAPTGSSSSTGLGTGDVTDPAATLTRRWRRMCRPVLDPRETAVRQVEQLGHAASDVRYVVLTHLDPDLDLDHGGGLRDFPDAEVHVLRSELDAALAARSRGRAGALPAPPVGARPRWRTYQATGSEWFGFRAVRDLPGLPPEILLVPLIGHTVGHTGVAVHHGGRWPLHAGDAYFFHGEVRADGPRCPPALRVMQDRVEVARGLRLENRERLRELVRAHGDEVAVFSAHDPVELRTMQQLRRAEPGVR